MLLNFEGLISNLMKLRKNIATSEAGLIFNPGTGDSFSVNNIGNEILSKLKENSSVEDIIGYISARYDVEKIQLEKDLDDFLSQLSDYNLLEKTI
jgi:hypothetical protein